MLALFKTEDDDTMHFACLVGISIPARGTPTKSDMRLNVLRLKDMRLNEDGMTSGVKSKFCIAMDAPTLHASDEYQGEGDSHDDAHNYALARARLAMILTSWHTTSVRSGLVWV